MAADLRYIKSEAVFKGYAFKAFNSHFESEAEFCDFYEGIKSEADKNEFLRVSSFYLFLVKSGKWQVDVEGVASDVAYLSASYKLVAVFSLIESLSAVGFVDFFGWLTAKGRRGVFPVLDAEHLKTHYEEYKSSHGSTRKCVAFFEKLPVSRQQQLCSAIEIDRKPLAGIKKVAQFLYNLRSSFVHEGRLVHAVGGGSVMYMQGKKLVHAQIGLDSLLAAFEEGLVAHFRGET